MKISNAKESHNNKSRIDNTSSGGGQYNGSNRFDTNGNNSLEVQHYFWKYYI